MTQKDAASEASDDLALQRLIDARVVMNLPLKHAAYYAGVSQSKAKAMLDSPEGKEAIEASRAITEAQYDVSRDRVVRGMVDAIGRARMLGEPNTEISGWKELAKMQGYYAATEHHVKVSHDQETLKRQLKELSETELLKLMSDPGLTPKDVIEGEFEEVSREN